MILRPYQREAIDAVHADMANDSQGSGLLYLATGTGKTVIAAQAAKEIGGKILFLVHRDELARQTVDKFKAVYPDASVGVVKAEQNELGMDITVASVQTLYNEGRLAQVALTQYDLVVGDECHHFSGIKWSEIISAFSGYKLGLTATPNRTDKARLDHAFSKILYSYSIIDGIRDGYLCDLAAKTYRVPQLDLDKIRTQAGDFKKASLSEMMRSIEVVKAVVDAWIKEGEHLKTAFFCVDVLHARELALELCAKGYAADYLDGSLPTDERRSRLERFRSGELQILTSCMVLTEGWDEPSVECIALARPTLSESLYIQMVGRGTRLHPGKERCLVLDFVGNATKHKIMQLGALTGFDPSLPAPTKKKGYREEPVQLSIPSLRDLILQGTHIDLVAVHPLQNRVDLLWVVDDDGTHYCVCGYGYKDGLYMIAKENDFAHLYHVAKNDWRMVVQLLGKYNSLDAAKEVAKKDMRERSPELLSGHTLYHNLIPPTGSQIRFLGEGAPPVKTKRAYQEAIASRMAFGMLGKLGRADSTDIGQHYINKLLTKKKYGMLKVNLSDQDIQDLSLYEVKELFYKHTITKEQKVLAQDMVRQLKMQLS